MKKRKKDTERERRKERRRDGRNEGKKKDFLASPQGSRVERRLVYIQVLPTVLYQSYVLDSRRCRSSPKEMTLRVRNSLQRNHCVCSIISPDS